MTAVIKNRTYGKIAGFWVIVNKVYDVRQVMAIAHLALWAS
jgi:hypothetical protein